MNKGQCILTQLEHWLNRRRGLPVPQQTEGQFVKRIMSLFCRRLPSDQMIEVIIYAASLTSAGLSYFLLSRASP